MASQTSGLSTFEQDTAVQLCETVQNTNDSLTFKCNVSDKWHIFQNLHGGYLAALLLRALSRSLPHPDPASVTVFFLRRGKPGPAEILVNKIKTEGSFSYGEAKLVQSGVEIARVVGTFTVLEENPSRIQYATTVKSPDIAPSEECIDLMNGRPRFGLFQQVKLLYTPDTQFNTPPTNRGEIKGWLEFRDERTVIDILALALLLDSNSPPGHHFDHPSLSNYPHYRSWYPTLTLTMYFRRKPKPNLRRVKGHWSSQYLIGRTLEVTGQVWDDEGQLLAQVSQLSVPVTPSSKL